MSATLPGVRRLSLPLPRGDALVGLALVVTAVVATARQPGVVHPATEVAAAVMVGAAALRTRAPLAMCAVAATAVVAYGLLPATGTPLWTFLGILVIAFSGGAHLGGRRRWAGLGLLLISSYVLQVVTSARLPAGELSWADVWISPLVIVGGPALAGGLLQRSQRQTARVRQLASELDAERQAHAEAATVAERNRIARELHDVISHSVSVMVVQAGAAEQQLPAGSPARMHVHAIRDTGKEALAELRRQLGVLGTGAASSAPMPGLADLAGLARRAGATLTCTGAPAGEASPGLELTIFRVVQEALTNASRHAAGARVEVRLVHGPDAIEVEVLDDGGAPDGQHGSGRGLAGMRERVQLYGGTVSAGRSGRGWRVHARIPRHPETS